MRIKATIIAGSVALLMVGCGGAAAPPPPDTSGLAALDAQATLAVWSARETAVAEETRRAQQATVDAANAAARATEMSEGATAQAIQAAGATVAAHGTAVAFEATATAGAGYLAATAQSAAATATRDGLAAEQLRLGIAATATADAAALAFQEALAEKALAARQAEIDRELMWNRLVPWLAGIVAVGAAAAMALFAGTWAVERLRRTRPQQAGDVWVMLGPGGPVALNRPPAQLPASLPRAPITVSTPALPAETPVPLPVPRRGGWLVAGMRGSGKTTAIQAVLRGRAGARIVIDPHDQAGKWPSDVRVIGRSGDYEAIEAFLVEEMARVLAERTRRLGEGVPERVLQAEPIFVVIDELPAIVERLGDGCMTSPRRWMYEMRKMGGDLLVSTQSLRVQAMGLKGYGDVRQMFDFTLALGDVAQAQFPSLAAGMARPAVLSTLASARPVIIPQVESNAIPAGDLDGDGDDDVILLPDGPLFTAPTPVAPKADPRNMRPEDVDRIRALKGGGWSQRAIEDEMFGYTGGAAWEAVREALDGGGRSWPAAATWPTPGQVLR